METSETPAGDVRPVVTLAWNGRVPLPALAASAMDYAGEPEPRASAGILCTGPSDFHLVATNCRLVVAWPLQLVAPSVASLPPVGTVWALEKEALALMAKAQRPALRGLAKNEPKAILELHPDRPHRLSLSGVKNPPAPQAIPWSGFHLPSRRVGHRVDQAWNFILQAEADSRKAANAAAINGQLIAQAVALLAGNLRVTDSVFARFPLVAKGSICAPTLFAPHDAEIPARLAMSTIESGILEKVTK